MSIRMPQLGSTPVWLHDCTSDPRHIAQYRQTYFRQDPWHTHPMKAGDVTTMDKVITPDVLRSTPFFREFMHEHGALHGMRAVICSDEAGSASLLCGRSKEQGNFTEQDLAQCKAMLPHLQQAVHSYQALVLAQLQSLQSGSGCGLSALLLDAQGYLLPLAQSRQDLARMPFIKTHESRPFVQEAEANSELQASILACQKPDTHAGACGPGGERRPQYCGAVAARDAFAQNGISPNTAAGGRGAASSRGLCQRHCTGLRPVCRRGAGGPAAGAWPQPAFSGGDTGRKRAHRAHPDQENLCSNGLLRPAGAGAQHSCQYCFCGLNAYTIWCKNFSAAVPIVFVSHRSQDAGRTGIQGAQQ